MSNRKRKVLDTDQQVYQKIGKRLKALRLEAGFSSAEKFAFELEIGRTQYTNYERGQDMKLSSLIRVLSFHNLSLDEFFRDMK